MVLKYGNEINEIEEEQAERTWFKPGAEFLVMFLILILILGGVAARASTKSIVISESVKGVSSESMFDEDVITDWSIIPVSAKSTDKAIYVPIPIMARPENISVENYYQDHTLFIRIKGAHAASFEEATITGATSHVLTAAFREYGGEVRISLLMDGIWDFNISQENTQLVIEPFKADERYENTVVIVAKQPEAEGTSETAYITSDVAEMAADLMSSLQTSAMQEEGNAENTDDISARIYVAQYRGDDEVLNFIKEADADIVVFLNTLESDDPTAYGMSAYYNGNYFIPELDNGYLAEAFLRNMATSASNKAIAIESAGEDSILNMLEIPAAEITIGYTSNPTESRYLCEEKYQRTIAEGIINAIKEVMKK